MHVLDVATGEDGSVLLEVESDDVLTGCPDCGVVAIGHGRRVQLLHDAPSFGRPVRAMAQADLAVSRTGVCSSDLDRGPHHSSATRPTTTLRTGFSWAQSTGKVYRPFYVNWFRRSPAGDFLWPGFGENSRVRKWIVERLEGRAQAVETAVGSVPSPASLDVDGLDLPPEVLKAVLTVDAQEWRAELALIEDWFAMLGPRLPTALSTELDGLADRIGSESPESVHGPMT